MFAKKGPDVPPHHAMFKDTPKHVRNGDSEPGLKAGAEPVGNSLRNRRGRRQ